MNNNNKIKGQPVELECKIKENGYQMTFTEIRAEQISKNIFEKLKDYMFENFIVAGIQYDDKNECACFTICGYVEGSKYDYNERKNKSFNGQKYKEKLQKFLKITVDNSQKVIFAEDGCFMLLIDEQLEIRNIEDCLNNCNFITNDGYVFCRVVNDEFYNEILRIEENLCSHEELRDYFRKNESFSIKELTDLGMKEGISFFIIPVAVWGNEQSILFRTKGNHFFYLGMSKIASSDYFIITDPFEYLEMKKIFRLNIAIDEINKKIGEKFIDFMNVYYCSI